MWGNESILTGPVVCTEETSSTEVPRLHPQSLRTELLQCEKHREQLGQREPLEQHLEPGAHQAVLASAVAFTRPRWFPLGIRKRLCYSPDILDYSKMSCVSPFQLAKEVWVF